MTTAIILSLAMLAGPPPESTPSLRLIVHVGTGRESDIVRSELKRDELWFLSKRWQIEQHYKIEVRESIFKGRPAYQIGTADDRHEFRPGTFSCAGSFTRALQSIAEMDQWERRAPDQYYGLYGAEIIQPSKPIEFPPRRMEDPDE